jgi:hypothetical protein
MKVKIVLILLISLLFSCSSKYEKFTNDLNSKESSVRVDAIERLRYDLVQENNKLLKIALKNSDDEVVWRAVEIIGKTKNINYISTLITLLQNKNPVIRYTARDAIIKLGSNSESYLLSSFQSSNKISKKLILQCLSEIGDVKTLNFKFKYYGDNIERKMEQSLLKIARRTIKKRTLEFVNDIIKDEKRFIN